jgi:hypothetical protein
MAMNWNGRKYVTALRTYTSSFLEGDFDLSDFAARTPPASVLMTANTYVQ